MTDRILFLEAPTQEDLIATLRRMRVSVPPLGSGRRHRKRAVEHWAIRRFLATCPAQSDLFRYPVRVEVGERPDFVIQSPTGTLGVEITEAVPEDLAKLRNIWGQESGAEPDALDRRPLPAATSHRASRVYQLFAPGQKLTAKQARQIPKARPGQCRILPSDTRIMDNWIQAMLWRIERKAAGFTYAPAEKNVLLVDDQWPSPLLPEHQAVPRLAQILSERCVAFDDIFIDRERSNSMFRLGRAELAMPIPDWCTVPHDSFSQAP